VICEIRTSLNCSNNLIKMTLTSLPFFVPTEGNNQDLNGHTLVLPCVSVGNVGQLAIDLLISTLLRDGKCKLVGRLNTTALRPIVGPNPYELSLNVMTSAEVYHSPSHKLVIVQIRSPNFKEKKRQFVGELVDWIKVNQFQKTIVLTSTYAQYISDLSPEERNPVRYMSSEPEAQIKLKQVQKVEQFSHRPTGDQSGLVHLPASGLAKKLFAELSSASLPTTVLVKYCSEGDNTPDAFDLVNQLNGLIGAKEIGKNGRVDWSVPVSWRALFGGDAPNVIY